MLCGYQGQTKNLGFRNWLKDIDRHNQERPTNVIEVSAMARRTRKEREASKKVDPFERVRLKKLRSAERRAERKAPEGEW
jgi:hypothetical protein